MRGGHNKHLVVAMRSYDPHVVCGPHVGEVPPIGSCQPAQLKISVDDTPIRFGRLSSQVITPQTIIYRKYRIRTFTRVLGFPVGTFISN